MSHARSEQKDFKALAPDVSDIVLALSHAAAKAGIDKQLKDRGRLARLEVPATIITALDDPIIPAHSLERLAGPSCLQLTVTRFGGHCGFLERLSGPSWVEQRIVAELDTERQHGEIGSVLTSA